MGRFVLLVWIILMVVAVLLRRLLAKRKRDSRPARVQEVSQNPGSCLRLLPGCWVVVKRRDVALVQYALSLHHARLCSWMEGLTNADGLFIAPPIKGWILVVGGRLPNPWQDVDACFRFMVNLSQKLGKVQLFSVNRSSLRHAWVMAEAGRILRAYAWAGQTIWTQGAMTRAETELQLACFDYAEALPEGGEAVLAANLVKIPHLAARWGLDPTRIQPHLLLKERGVAGEPAHRY